MKMSHLKEKIKFIKTFKGVYALVALMVKSACDNLEGVLFPTPSEIASGHINNTNYLSNDPAEGRVMIGSALCFYVGIIHVCMLSF